MAGRLSLSVPPINPTREAGIPFALSLLDGLMRPLVSTTFQDFRSACGLPEHLCRLDLSRFAEPSVHEGALETHLFLKQGLKFTRFAGTSGLQLPLNVFEFAA